MNRPLVVLALAAAGWCGCLGGCDRAGGRGPWNPFHRSSQAHYTIKLYRYTGPDHMRTAARGKRAAAEMAGLPDPFILHERAASTLYAGRYRTREAAMDDLRRAQQWQSPSRLRPFQAAFVMPYPTEDPQANPAWDLERADGAYTVLVEVYHNDPKKNMNRRKEAAVQRCKELREEGEEAYYYHGPANSVVTIGLFDDSAVKMVRKGPVTRPVILSREMKSIMKRRPHVYTNARKRQVAVPALATGKPMLILRPTYPVRVPQSSEDDVDESFLGLGDRQPR
jgi:hypothetical protein